MICLDPSGAQAPIVTMARSLYRNAGPFGSVNRITFKLYTYQK